MKGEIKAVIFDVNGVLLLGEGKSFHQYVAKKLKLDIETWFDSIDQYWSPLVEGKISKEKFLIYLSKNFNRSPERIEKIIKKAFKKSFKKNRWLFKQLFILNKLGYKTAILSDQVPMSYEVFEKKYNLSPKVDVAVWSEKVKLRKPNPKIYKLCLKHLNVKPNQAIFIDNREWNLIPAEKLGIKTILFTDNKRLNKNPIWKGLFK